MAPTYTLGRVRRSVNGLVKFMLRNGLAGKNNYLLTVVGRKSGTPYSTPITLVTQDGRRYLVAPYGEVAWVKNARAAGKVELSRKGISEDLAIREVDAHEAAPVLRAYVNIAKTTRPYFEVKPGARVEEFEVIAAGHPVFRLEPIAASKA